MAFTLLRRIARNAWLQPCSLRNAVTSTLLPRDGGSPVRNLDDESPILTREEIAGRALELLVAGTLIPYRRSCPESSRPPPLSSSTPRPPVEALREYDELYVKKGLIPPSEVLHEFVRFTPTFFVELRRIAATAPSHLWQRTLESGATTATESSKPSRFFALYPMVFKLEQHRFQRTLIKLNTDFDFVVNHPDFKKADPEHRKFSQEFSLQRGVLSREKVRISQTVSTAAPSALPSYLRIATIPIETQVILLLAMHFPREEDKRHRFLRLSDWIPTLPQDHLDILNSISEQRLVSVVRKYCRIFQLATDDERPQTTFFRLRPTVDVALPPGEGGDAFLNAIRNELIDMESVVEQPVDSEPTVALTSLFIRRLPPEIAPGSLSDLTEATSPLPHILRRCLQLLTSATHWVSIQKLYAVLSPDEKSELRKVQGLPNFLRLHGSVVEVSADVRYAILHRQSIPPLIPSQETFSAEERAQLPAGFDTAPDLATAANIFLLSGEQDRAKYRRILGDSQVPKNRIQLRLLDPSHPLLDNSVLLDELHEFLPDFPVCRDTMMRRLPPLIRAAFPSRQNNLLANDPRFRVWRDAVTGKHMVAKREVVGDEEIEQIQNGATWSLTRALQFVDSKVPATGGIEASLLVRELPFSLKTALRRETDTHSVEDALRMFPERFSLVFQENGIQFVHRSAAPAQ